MLPKSVCTICDKALVTTPTTLANHVRKQHPKSIEEMEKNQPPVSVVSMKKARNVYEWINLIVEANLPFTIVNQEVYRKFSKFESICYNFITLLLFAQMKQSIAEDLPEKFGLTFDGWTECRKSFIAILLPNMFCLL
jgi:hypothetical protein